MYITNFIDAFDMEKSKNKYNEKYDYYTLTDEVRQPRWSMAGSPLYIKILHVLGVRLNKFPSRLYLIAHKGSKGQINLRRIRIINHHTL